MIDRDRNIYTVLVMYAPYKGEFELLKQCYPIEVEG